MIHDFLKEVHDKTGHMGVEKTLARLEGRAWWPGYTKDVKNWVCCCEVCARRNGDLVWLCSPALKRLYSPPLKKGHVKKLPSSWKGP